ncbi:MAG: proteasome subunit beta [Promethearchaeota archaeon]
MRFPSGPEPTDAQKMEMLKTGTTTIGIIIKDGVIMATESQATAGFFVATKHAQKLFKINEKSAITIAGGVADAQYIVGQAQAISRLWKVQHDVEPDVNYLSNVVRNILFNGRSFFYSWNIVGGLDKDGVGHVYPIDFLGFMADREDFCSLGSGSTFALGVLEGNWKPNMTKEEGIALVTQALTASRARDAGSGYALQIVSITKENGFEVIEGPISKEK